MVRGGTPSTSPTIGIRRRFTVTPIYRQESRQAYSLARRGEYRTTLGDGRTRTGAVTTSMSTSTTITLRTDRNTLAGGGMASGRTYPSTAMVWPIGTTAPGTDLCGPTPPRSRRANRIVGVT